MKRPTSTQDPSPPSFRDTRDTQQQGSISHTKSTHESEVQRYQVKLANFLSDEIGNDLKQGKKERSSPRGFQDDIKRVTMYVLNQVKTIIKPDHELIRALQAILQLFEGCEPWIPSRSLEWKQLQKLLNQKFLDLIGNYRSYMDRIHPDCVKAARTVLGNQQSTRRQSPRNTAQQMIVKLAHTLIDYFEGRLSQFQVLDEVDVSKNFFTKQQNSISPIIPQQDYTLDITWPFQSSGSQYGLVRKEDIIDTEDIQMQPPQPHVLSKPQQMQPIQPFQPPRQNTRLNKNKLQVEIDNSKPTTSKNTPSQSRMTKTTTNSSASQKRVNDKLKTTTSAFSSSKTNSLFHTPNKPKSIKIQTPETKQHSQVTTKQNSPSNKFDATKNKTETSNKTNLVIKSDDIDLAIQQHKQLIEQLQKQEMEIKQRIATETQKVLLLEQNTTDTTKKNYTPVASKAKRLSTHQQSPPRAKQFQFK